MGIFDRFLGRKASAADEARARELTYDQVANLIDSRIGGVAGGVVVTEHSALQVSTVLSCVKVLADGCAAPELHVYREGTDSPRTLARKRPEYRLLNRRPNEWQTSFEWRRMMTAHAALCEAGLSIKVRGDTGKLLELIPVKPGSWECRKVSRYEYRYRVWDEFGMIGDFSPDDVFVLPGFAWDVLKGLPAVALARNAIGLAISSERSQQASHENGVRPSGVFSVNGRLSDEQYKRITKYIDENGGAINFGKPLVLDMDGKFQPMSTSAVDAQMVETRRLQIEEICRAFNVFPIMIGHSDKSATFASSEAFFSAHLKHTLHPWHTLWRQRLDEFLLDGDGPLWCEFDTRYMRAGSMADRGAWARTMREMGIYTGNELRDEEGLDPLPGLDSPLQPMNMQPVNGEPNGQPTEPAGAA